MDKLLISTMLKFVYFDGDKSHILHEGALEEGTAHYHGITWDNAGILYITGTIDAQYIVLRFTTLDMHELPPIPEDRNLLHGAHQIIWIDGTLYVNNTGLNRIEMFDGRSWCSKAWNPATCDIDHINGIWSDGHHVYVSEHRQAIEPGGSLIRKCALESLDSLGTIHMGPDIHNVYVEDGVVYCLTSFRPAILAANVKDKSVVRIDKPEWGKVLVRGLARTEDYWYIGLSRWEPDPSKRHVGDAIVVQLDNNFNETDRILMQDYGPVCDVRVVDRKDMAHNGIVMDGSVLAP